MDEDNKLAMIAKLESRMDNVEGEIERIREEQDKLKIDIHEAALESNTMSGKINDILGKLEEMARRKIRTVDIVILIVGLIIGATSAYATIQNNHLTQVMVELTREMGAK